MARTRGLLLRGLLVDDALRDPGDVAAPFGCGNLDLVG